MPKLSKIVSATCSNCNKTLQEGDTVYTLDAHFNGYVVGKNFNLEDETTWSSTKILELCSECYKRLYTFIEGNDSPEYGIVTPTVSTTFFGKSAIEDGEL